MTAASAAPHPFATPEAARYLPTDHLGRGGMGRVTAVFDRRLGREVARKDVPYEAADIDSLERRLEREARITARLDHPGIVPIHDAGTDPLGHPYFTMRFIRGRSLAAALLAKDLAPTTLLRHFLSVCDAIAHAHARGVVHRDLKPDNIMLGPHGETQVVDWGVARVLDEPDLDPGAASPDTHGHTVAGARVGTVAWMSPEQARGEPVGRSADVYSLGLVLGRIVALMGSAEPEIQAIQTRATASSSQDRYADAGALSQDLAAYLDGRRVSAFTYSPLDLARRFYKAFRAPILIAVGALALVLAVLVVSYSETRHERDLAELAEARAEAALRASEESYATVLVERAIDAWRQGARAEAELLAAAALLRKDSAEARAILALGAPFASLEAATTVPSCLLRRLSPDGKALACLGLDRLSVWALDLAGSTASLELLWELPSRWHALGWFGGAHLLVEGRDGHQLLDLETSASFPNPQAFVAARARSTAERALVDTAEALFVVDIDDNTTSLILGVPRRLPWAISGNGEVALTYDEATRRPQRIDLETTEYQPIELALEDGPMSAAMNRDGRLAAFGTSRGRLMTLDLDTKTSRLFELSDRPLTHLAFSPDGRWLAARDERGFVTVVSNTSAEHIALPRIQVESFIWRDGRLVTLGAELLAWRLPETPSAFAYRATAGISALAVSRSNQQLALADGAGALSLFDLETGHLQHRLTAEVEGVAKDLAFTAIRGEAKPTQRMKDSLAGSLASPGLLRDSPTAARPAGDPRLSGPEQASDAADSQGGEADPAGQNISKIELSCDGPAIVAIWPGRFETASWCPPRPLRRATSRTNYRRLVALHDGAFLTATYGVGLDHFATPDSAPSAIPLSGNPIDLVSTHDGGTWAALTATGSVHLGRDHQVTQTLSVDPSSIALALSNAATLAYLTAEHAVLELESGTTHTFTPPAPEARLAAIALSPDGGLLAVGTLEGRVLVWRTSAQAPTLLIDGRAHGQRVSDLAFTTSQALVSASWDGTALRWRLSAPAPTLMDLERRHGFGVDHATRADLR